MLSLVIGLILCLMENIDRIEREYCCSCGKSKDCTVVKLFKIWKFSRFIGKRADGEYGCSRYEKLKRKPTREQEEIQF